MKISEWISENLDSHGIFGSSILDSLDECDNINALEVDGEVLLDYKDRTKRVSLSNERQVTEAIERRGLGGYFDPGDEEYFVIGWSFAENLRILIANTHTEKMGRGWIFREAVEKIKEAGE